MSAPRWWSYVKRRRLVCPAGHRIPNTFDVSEAGFVRCPKHVTVSPTQRHQCGRWVFLLAIRGDGVIVAEVSLAEKAAMLTLKTPTAMLDFLGIFKAGQAGGYGVAS